MIVVKNINNNVSLCLDSRNKEVVVFGRGVGFIKPPHEIPLKQIERTFYDLSDQLLSLLNDIPSEVISFTAREIADVQSLLPYDVNSNLVFTLADHIAFAMERAKKGIFIPMPSIYEMEVNYPIEVRIGRQFVADVEKEYKTLLPKGEIQGIAMHFINARNGNAGDGSRNIEEQFETILDNITRIIEHEMNIYVQRDAFSYVRFATHVQYLLKRLFENKHIDSANIQMYESIRDEYKTVSGCVDKIGEYLKSNWNAKLTEEEKLYLIMHVNRVCCKETE